MGKTSIARDPRTGEVLGSVFKIQSLKAKAENEVKKKMRKGKAKRRMFTP